MSQAQQKGIPSPAERPDLYDSYDGAVRPAGWQNPVATPSRLQQRIADRKAKAAAQQPAPAARPAPTRERVAEPA